MSIPSTSAAHDPGLPSKVGYSIGEAVAASGLSRSMIYLLIRDGKLVARKCGARTIIEASELRLCLANLPRAGEQAA